MQQQKALHHVQRGTEVSPSHSPTSSAAGGGCCPNSRGATGGLLKSHRGRRRRRRLQKSQSAQGQLRRAPKRQRRSRATGERGALELRESHWSFLHQWSLRSVRRKFPPARREGFQLLQQDSGDSGEVGESSEFSDMEVEGGSPSKLLSGWETGNLANVTGMGKGLGPDDVGEKRGL